MDPNKTSKKDSRSKEQDPIKFKHKVVGTTNCCETKITINVPRPIRGGNNKANAKTTTESFNSHNKVDATTYFSEISAVDNVVSRSNDKVKDSNNSTYEFDGNHTGTKICTTRTVTTIIEKRSH